MTDNKDGERLIGAFMLGEDEPSEEEEEIDSGVPIAEVKEKKKVIVIR